MTLDERSKVVLTFARTLFVNDKVVLIGYSGGGFAITQIADELNGTHPHKIDRRGDLGIASLVGNPLRLTQIATGLVVPFTGLLSLLDFDVVTEVELRPPRGPCTSI